jgi:hypothetical protein
MMMKSSDGIRMGYFEFFSMLSATVGKMGITQEQLDNVAYQMQKIYGSPQQQADTAVRNVHERMRIK